MGATAVIVQLTRSARNPFRGTGPWLYWADPQSRFNTNPEKYDPQLMIKDLTRLLKASQAG